MMGHGLFNLVDMIIVARLGVGAVAAVTIGGIILPVAMVLFDGIINVTVALVSQFHGARQDRAARHAAWESLLVTAIAGLAGGAAFFSLAGPLVRFFALQDAATTAGAIAYLRVMAAGMIGMFLILHTTAVLRGVGNSLAPMAILIGANLLNVGLDIALVFGNLGFPRLGVVGAAWATVIAQCLGGLFGFWLLWRGTHGLALRGHRWRLPFRYLRTLVVVGLPTSLQLATRVLAVFFLLRIGREAVAFGEAFLDGVGICIRLEMIAVFLGLGWAAAATPFVGQSLGAGLPDRAARGTWVFVSWAAATMAVIGILLWLFREPVIGFIMPGIGPESLGYALEYLRITVPCYGILAVSLVLSRALNGAGSTKTAMTIDVVLYLAVLLPLATAWSQSGLFGVPEPDPAGAWWAAASVHVLAAILYVIVFLRGHWKRKRLARRRTPMTATAAWS
jgi:putative MATE family efflux protein